MANITIGSRHTPMPVKSGRDLASRLQALRTILSSPWVWIGLFALTVTGALSANISVPIGPNYWDLTFYIDAAHRISTGQTPHLDFFPPVGALGFYSYWILSQIFPAANPAVLAQYALLPVALPILALIVHVAQRSSAILAYGILLPFLVFAAVPINSEASSLGSGIDAFGIYNRHAALLLYLLVAAICVLQAGALRIATLAALGLALFFMKITGFAAGGMIVTWALLTQRLRLREVLYSALVVIAVLLFIEFTTGMVAAYLRDIIAMLNLNHDSFITRLKPVVILHFDVIALTAVLMAVLAFTELKSIWRKYTLSDGNLKDIATWDNFAIALRSNAAFLAVVFLAATFYETQNAGSLEYVLTWPLLLVIGLGLTHFHDRTRTSILILIATLVIPTSVAFSHRAIRSIATLVSQEQLNEPALGPIGRVLARPDQIAHARTMYRHYSENQAAYRKLSAQKIDPVFEATTQPTFQLTWLIASADAIKALRAYEIRHAVKFKSMYTIDYVNPIPAILQTGKTGTGTTGTGTTGTGMARHVPLAVAPLRSSPPRQSLFLPELAKVDVLLHPKCPAMALRDRVTGYFAKALNGRRKVALTPCWDMYLKN